MPTTDRRERQQFRAKHGMRVTGRGVFTVLAVLGRRARSSRTGPSGRAIDRHEMVVPDNPAKANGRQEER